MRIDFLEDYIHIAKRLNITQSAAELHTSQPALSMRLSSIEKEVGCKLFERSNAGLALNESGRVFLEYAQEIVRLYKEGVAASKKARKNAPVKVYIQEFDDLIALLPKDHPVRLVELDFDTPISNALSDRLIDVAIDCDYSQIPSLRDRLCEAGILYIPIGYGPDSATLRGRHPMFTAVMRSHPLAAKRSIGRRDFEGRTVAINTGGYFDLWPDVTRHVLGGDVHVEFKLNRLDNPKDIAFVDFKDAVYTTGSPEEVAILVKRPDMVVFDTLDGEVVDLPYAIACRIEDYCDELGPVRSFVRQLVESAGGTAPVLGQTRQQRKI